MDKSTNKGPLLHQFQTLVEIVARLRGPDGCPQDKKQTQKTLTQYAIEEAFELVEAIEKNDHQEIKEELGDFLFQVILQAQVAQDEGQFTLLEVIETLNEKMVRRHPHVFGDAGSRYIQEVWKNWEQIKAKEKQDKQDKQAKSNSNSSSTLSEKPVFSYPVAMPALQAAQKIGGKTKRLKFDWQTPEQVFAKVEEEIKELQAEVFTASRDPEKLENEIGDVLFSVAQLARHLNLEPEQCLRKANRRFESRFMEVLKLSGVSIEKFPDLSDDEKEKLWAQAKKNLESKT